MRTMPAAAAALLALALARPLAAQTPAAAADSAIRALPAIEALRVTLGDGAVLTGRYERRPPDSLSVDGKTVPLASVALVERRTVAADPPFEGLVIGLGVGFLGYATGGALGAAVFGLPGLFLGVIIDGAIGNEVRWETVWRR